MFVDVRLYHEVVGMCVAVPEVDVHPEDMRGVVPLVPRAV